MRAGIPSTTAPTSGRLVACSTNCSRGGGRLPAVDTRYPRSHLRARAGLGRGAGRDAAEDPHAARALPSEGCEPPSPRYRRALLEIEEARKQAREQAIAGTIVAGAAEKQSVLWPFCRSPMSARRPEHGVSQRRDHRERHQQPVATSQTENNRSHLSHLTASAAAVIHGGRERAGRRRGPHW